MKSKFFFIGAIVILLMATVITWAFAQDGGAILACAAKDGTLRLIADPAECKEDNETILEWNIVGPQGETGPAGLQGPVGDMGPQGETGPRVR